MSFSHIIILKEYQKPPVSRLDTTIIHISELGRWIKSGKIIKHLFQHKKAILYTRNWKTTTKPLLSAFAVRTLTHGACQIEDENGQTIPINITFLFSLFFNFCKDLLKKSQFLHDKNTEIEALFINTTIPAASFYPDAQPVYLRFDLSYNLIAGGSVSHTTGVLNNLEHYSSSPIYISSMPVPGINSSIKTKIIKPHQRFLDFDDLPFLYSNEYLFNQSKLILDGQRLSFVYQRYSLYNFTGLQLSRNRKVPFILEYNGSEIWVYKNWSKALKYEKLAEKIELLNLNTADVVVVVSQALKNDLVDRGVSLDKILVNPNGVDPEIYSPNVDGSKRRRPYQLKDKTVIGFIGTFGRWHGAEVLVKAYGLLLKVNPEYRETTHLLMIGDGNTLPLVKAEIEHFKIAGNVTLTGIVPQEEGPEYLAACDLLVSPHVPNSDGTPFFGSPTKLFEYMAMGKGIVASDLDQIGEVLKHDETAWMVKPGDSESLMHGLKTMIDHPETARRLGDAARREVVAQYTWKEHTCKIIEKLKERCPCK